MFIFYLGSHFDCGALIVAKLFADSANDIDAIDRFLLGLLLSLLLGSFLDSHFGLFDDNNLFGLFNDNFLDDNNLFGLFDDDFDNDFLSSLFGSSLGSNLLLLGSLFGSSLGSKLLFLCGSLGSKFLLLDLLLCGSLGFLRQD